MNDEEIFHLADKYYELEEFEKAYQLFLQLADRDDSSAMGRLALMCAEGEGVPKDFALSIAWDVKAAELGDAISMFNLGITYRDMGDLNKACFWLSKSLDSGNGEAALILAKIYMNDNVKKDTSKNINRFLLIAVSHTNICEHSRDEAQKLLRSNS